MKILQIEDRERYLLDGVDSVATLEEAQELMKKQDYGIFVLDGNFPLNKGDEPDINVQAAVEFIKSKNPGAKIIVWANSIRAQKYAEDNNITRFAKKEKSEEHIQKMKQYGLKGYPEVKDKEHILEEIR